MTYEEFREELERRKKAVCPLLDRPCLCEGCTWWQGCICAISQISDNLENN